MDAQDPYSEPEPQTSQETEGVEETTLVPRSFFGGDVEPGHRCDVEVVACHEDECEIKCVKSEKPKEEGGIEEAHGELEKMAVEKPD